MRLLPASAALLSLLAAVAPAAELPQFKDLFPAAAAPQSAGQPVSVRVKPGLAGELRVTPVIFLSRAGLNPGEGGSKSMCGVVISTPGKSLQGVVTVGTGTTEATPSCDAILAIGALPPARSERTQRIGLVHAVSSRNADNGRAAIVLQQGTGGNWIVDGNTSERLGNTLVQFTIAEMRRKLR